VGRGRGLVQRTTNKAKKYRGEKGPQKKKKHRGVAQPAGCSAWKKHFIRKGERWSERRKSNRGLIGRRHRRERHGQPKAVKERKQPKQKEKEEITEVGIRKN